MAEEYFCNTCRQSHKSGEICPVPIHKDDNACGICGSKKVYIRGKHPGHDNRLVCPTCVQERLEQINEISSREYGLTAMGL